MKNKRLFLILLISASLLLLPLLAMLFTTEVNWQISDFILAGALLFGVSLACELVLLKFKKTKTRFILCGLLLVILLLIWIELAVGIFGTPFGGH